jgi:hypothetical protein
MGMLPGQIDAWSIAISALIKIGGYAISEIKSWFKKANVALTDEQIAAAWKTIEADDRVRLAIAEAAAGE